MATKEQQEWLGKFDCSKPGDEERSRDNANLLNMATQLEAALLAKIIAAEAEDGKTKAQDQPTKSTTRAWEMVPPKPYRMSASSVHNRLKALTKETKVKHGLVVN